MLFTQIPGLDSTKSRLLRAIQSRHIAHAQLFFGNEGGASLALALAYCRYLHCENRQPADSCGKCASCRKYDKLIHPDLHFVFPVATTKKVESKPLSQDFYPEWRAIVIQHPYFNLSDWLNHINADSKQGNISVDESREVVKKLSMKAFEGEFKILLLWLPEIMNIQSANALLKILEEPPPQTIFLLVCQDRKRLLATIISRLQMVQIPPFEDEAVQQHLQAKFSLSAAEAQQIAYLANGSMNEAYRVRYDAPNDLHEWFRAWMRECYGGRIKELIMRTDDFATWGKEEQKKLLLYGLGVCRESLVFQSGEGDLLRLSGDKLAFIKGFASTMNLDKLESLYKLLNEALYHLERNASVKITFLDMSLLLAQMMQQR